MQPVGASAPEAPSSVYHTPNPSPQQSPKTSQSVTKIPPAENPQVLEPVGEAVEPLRECPKRTRKVADKNADYHQAVDLEEQRRENRREAKRARLSENTKNPTEDKTHRTLLDIQARADDPELSDLTDSTELEDNEETYFAGISQSGPSSHPLP
ncbi:hypothetical protein C0993_004602 [Termitomyces sp. T159_Od127]|nr:hypothetical protein C0993_004602 [Termitomyces sp. T159_Od127]